MTDTQNTYDVIIIGAGHNGLAAAATLAKKGKKVCVLERSTTIGGMSGNRDADGLAIPQIAHLAHNLNPVVMKELGLSKTLKFKDLNTIALSPDGKHLEISDEDVMFADGSEHPDAVIFKEIKSKIKRYARLLAPLALKTPPDMSGGVGLSNFSEVAPLAKLGFNLKRMGKKEMREFMRIFLSNIYDLLMDDMEDGLVAGSLAADATWGMWTGPKSPGTVLSLMYRYGTGGKASLPIGGMGAVCDALYEVATHNNAVIRTGAGVKSIKSDNDCVSGVVLEDGTEIAAKAVMSSAGAFASMMLAGHEHYDVEATRRLRNVRAKGTTAKVNIVLSDQPEFTGLSAEQHSARLVVAPSANYVERAFNKVKYGELADDPVIEMVIPTLSDPSISNGTSHVLSAVVQFVPYYLEGGWSDAKRQTLTDIVVGTLSKYAPDLKGKIASIETLSPADIERETGAPGGHWHHAEFSTDQMLNVRPVNGLGRYKFGLKGFYLCGASAHPGGDVSGAAGRNSALQLLKDGVLS